MDTPRRRKARMLKMRYGIRIGDFDRRLELQKGLCGICRNPMKRVCIDHDHETGKVRELLCYRCNLLVGYLEKGRDFIAGALDYIAAHSNIKYEDRVKAQMRRYRSRPDESLASELVTLTSYRIGLVSQIEDLNAHIEALEGLVTKKAELPGRASAI